MSTSLPPQRQRPPALRRGDTVGIIAPASPIQRETLEAGCAGLERMGYKTTYLPSILELDGFFAGSVDRRLNELHEMFERSEVRAIVCARGGYGCNYLLPQLDFELIRSNPKIFVGCSDITSLLADISDSADMVTFHGPMMSDWGRPNGVDEDSWLAATALGVTYDRQFAVEDGVRVLRAGEARGRLQGGCLSLLCASLGTPYEVRTEGTILFLEDVNEPAYRIDRMLMQLKLAGKFDGVRGMILGEMLRCNGAAAQSQRLAESVRRVMRDFRIPVVMGVRSGHVSQRNLTLPIGGSAVLRATTGSVAVSFEAAVRREPATIPVPKA